MNDNEVFNAQLAKGKLGEKIVSDYFTKQGCYVKDVSGIREYQNKDIDFVIDGLTYEVKTDYMFSKTGNLALELENVFSDGYRNAGWLYGSEAEYIIFINPKNTTKFVIAKHSSLLDEGLLNNLQTRTHYDRCGDKEVIIKLLPYRFYKELFEVINTTE